MFCLTLCIVRLVPFFAHASTQTCFCHLSEACNTSLILIIWTGEQPGVSCGSIAFGCLQFSGSCFSRLGCSTASTLSETRCRAKYEALGCSVFPAGVMQPTGGRADGTSSRVQKWAPTASGKNYVAALPFFFNAAHSKAGSAVKSCKSSGC